MTDTQIKPPQGRFEFRYPTRVTSSRSYIQNWLLIINGKCGDYPFYPTDILRNFEKISYAFSTDDVGLSQDETLTLRVVPPWRKRA